MAVEFKAHALAAIEDYCKSRGREYEALINSPATDKEPIILDGNSQKGIALFFMFPHLFVVHQHFDANGEPCTTLMHYTLDKDHPTTVYTI